LDNSFHLDDIIDPATDGIVRALSDRPGQTEAQRETRRGDAETFILSFRPRDAIELMLCGQSVLFNELLADGAKDVLRGMVDTMKLKSIGGLVNMARIVQGHVDRLDKRGIAPAREVVVAAEEKKPAAVAEPCPVDEARPATVAAAVEDETVARAAALASLLTGPASTETAEWTREQAPAVETSWLDGPFEQWVVETPAEIAARSGDGLAVAVQSIAEAADRAGRNGAARADVAPRAEEPALPRMPSGYSPVAVPAEAESVAGD
jgi:hypothetical protein